MTMTDPLCANCAKPLSAHAHALNRHGGEIAICPVWLFLPERPARPEAPTNRRLREGQQPDAATGTEAGGRTRPPRTRVTR